MSSQPKKSRVRPVVPETIEAEPVSPPPAKPSAPRSAQAPVSASQPAQEPVVVEPGSQEPVTRPSWTLDATNGELGEKLEGVRSEITYWVQKGRFNKVRVMREGKQVLPDIPVGALLAAEVATFAWAGALRAAAVNVAGRLLFKVELVNDAAEHLVAAKGHYAKGDLDEAEAEAVRAVTVDSRMAEAFLLLGTLAKVRGKPEEALKHLRRARDLDAHGEIGRQAEAAGRKLDPEFAPPPSTSDKP